MDVRYIRLFLLLNLACLVPNPHFDTNWVRIPPSPFKPVEPQGVAIVSPICPTLCPTLKQALGRPVALGASKRGCGERPSDQRRLGFGSSRMKLRSRWHRLRIRRGRQLGNRCLQRRMHMKKLSVIGATLLGAAVLCAATTMDKAQARYGPGGALLRGHAAVPAGTACKTAAKLEFP